MNSIRSKSFGIALFALVLACGFAHAQSVPLSRQKDGVLVITAKITSVVGFCNAVKCPDVQYGLATTKIFNNGLFPGATPSQVSVLKACGPSGFVLGSHLRFYLRSGVKFYVDTLDKPMSDNGDALRCDVVFSAKDAEPAPIRYWR